METESDAPRPTGKCSPTRGARVRALARENCKTRNAPRLRETEREGGKGRGDSAGR